MGLGWSGGSETPGLVGLDRGWLCQEDSNVTSDTYGEVFKKIVPGSSQCCLVWWQKREVERGEVQGSGFGLDVNRDIFPMKTSKQVSRTVHPPSTMRETNLGKVLRCLVWPWSCPYFSQGVGVEIWTLLSSFLKQVLTALTHMEAHSTSAPNTSILTPGTNSSAAAGTEYPKNQSPFLWLGHSPQHVCGCLGKSFSRKIEYETVLIESVHKQIKNFNNISWVTLIANIFLRSLWKEENTLKKYSWSVLNIFKNTDFFLVTSDRQMVLKKVPQIMNST